MSGYFEAAVHSSKSNLFMSSLLPCHMPQVCVSGYLEALVEPAAAEDIAKAFRRSCEEAARPKVRSRVCGGW